LNRAEAIKKANGVNFSEEVDHFHKNSIHNWAFPISSSKIFWTV